MAKVISVSVPDELYTRWEESDLDISPSSLFQTALETQLGAKNQLVMYWSERALDDEKKLTQSKRSSNRIVKQSNDFNCLKKLLPKIHELQQ